MTTRTSRRVFGIALVVLTACARSSAPTVESAVIPVRAGAPVQADAAAWADSVVATLTLRERAAQMVWPSIVGDYLATDDDRWLRIAEWIRNDRVGGFTVSVGSPFDIAVKLDAMQALSRVPLFFGADFEAGAGFRARGGVFLPNAIELGGATWTPPLMSLGAAGDTTLAFALGRMTAVEGRALGVHIVYGPVLDVNNNAANPVINVRSFGEDPALVGRLGAAFIRGVQAHGMLATGKHFPGHGDTEVNSHLALPVVGVSRARLDSVELVPFRAAVQARVGAMMTFHGALPALDSTQVPATLSPGIIGGILRGELGFSGVAITDAMDMRGVLDRFGPQDAAQRAVAAGADVLIQPQDVRATIDAIEAGVAAGRYPESRVTDAARRILRAKAALGLNALRRLNVAMIRENVGSTPNRALADTIAARGLTLVRDERTLVPFRAATRVISVTVARRPDLTAGVHFDAALRAGGVNVRSAFVDADVGTADAYTSALAGAVASDVVVVASYVATRWDAASISQSTAFVDFVNRVAAAHPMIVIAFGNPYLLQQIPTAPGYLVAWSGAPAVQRAAGRAVVGQGNISGRLPISIPPVAVRGAGLTRRANR